MVAKRVAGGRFGEDFGGEGFDGCAALPGIGGEAGFSAGFGEEALALPPPFNRDLRQQETAMAVVRDHEAVFADFDFLRRNGYDGRQDTDLNFELCGFSVADRKETWIFEGGGRCGLDDGEIERAHGNDVADAAAQLAIQM